MQLGKKAEAHLRRIIDVLYYIMILLGFYLFMRYAFWLAFPFLFAFFVAMLLQKPMNYAHRKVRLKKGFSAVVLVLLFYVLIFGIIGYAGVRLFGMLRSFFEYLSGLHPAEILETVARQIPGMLTWLPGDRMEASVAEAVERFCEKLANGEDTGMWDLVKANFSWDWFKAPVTGLLVTASKIPAMLVAVVITIVSSLFMTLGYDSLVVFIKRQLPAARQEALSTTKHIAVRSMGKLLRSYAILMGVTFSELMLGLGLLLMIGVRGSFEARYLLPIALATAVVDILPVLGTGSVLVPWALYHLIMQNYGMAVGIAIVYVVILVVRQVLEPKVISANLGLPPIATLAGMYIGLQLFGFIGMLIVPLLLILIKLLNDEGVVHVWKPAPQAAEPAAEDAPPPAQAPKKKRAGRAVSRFLK
ncbi:MAG: sporulation integral membrane protein YtvI [Oscillospiraceae bacterium]|jgi:sporulation integral membrane protein YtvI|nr:sporulation integral membrane protein YtvI [Oscillospiraceae bacterium]